MESGFVKKVFISMLRRVPYLTALALFDLPALGYLCRFMLFEWSPGYVHAYLLSYLILFISVPALVLLWKTDAFPGFYLNSLRLLIVELSVFAVVSIYNCSIPDIPLVNLACLCLFLLGGMFMAYTILKSFFFPFALMVSIPLLLMLTTPNELFSTETLIVYAERFLLIMLISYLVHKMLQRELRRNLVISSLYILIIASLNYSLISYTQDNHDEQIRDAIQIEVLNHSDYQK